MFPQITIQVLLSLQTFENLQETGWNSQLFSKLSQWKTNANVVLLLKNTYKCYKIEKQILKKSLLTILLTGCKEKEKKEKRTHTKFHQQVRTTSFSLVVVAGVEWSGVGWGVWGCCFL